MKSKLTFQRDFFPNSELRTGNWEALSASIDTIPTNAFCSAGNDEFDEFQDTIPDPDLVWESIVADTAYWGGLSAAEQTFMQQEIYGLLLQHPEWKSGSSILSGFYDDLDASYAGQSETLRRDWQALAQGISEHHEGQEGLRGELDSLTGLAAAWIEAIGEEEDSAVQDSLQLLLSEVLQYGDSLNTILTESDSVYWLEVLDTISVLQVRNDALPDSLWHYWFEKRYNEIALDWMAGAEPDSSAEADLRLIAQTCLSDGGRAVLAARGLSETWLKEYYGEDSCQAVVLERSAAPVPVVKPANAEVFLVLPNPASEVVQVMLRHTPAGEYLPLQVYNITGRMVYSGLLPAGSRELIIPVSGWSEGIYVVRLQLSGKVQSRTFVVQHH